MRGLLLFLGAVVSGALIAQNNTDVSLFFKKDSCAQLSVVSSEAGDLFKTLGHHGPAVENEWLGFRIYFDYKAAIDVYSKTKIGLELQEVFWYPTAEQQKEGWGADYYKVGETVGLGSVRLWDGEKVVPLNPVSNRSARVVKEGNISYMEMFSEGVPFKNMVVDILVRVTVYSSFRNAKIEAFALSDDEVQFVTGVNYHKGQRVIKEDNYVLTWGLHPEDIAAQKVELGAAILFNSAQFSDKMDDGSQILLISKSTKYLAWWISSANEKEFEINTLEKFVKFVSDSKP